MEIHPIKSAADYQATLQEIESLMSAEFDTPEGNRLDILMTLVEAYERQHYPIDFPDPIDAIKFRMTSKGLAWTISWLSLDAKTECTKSSFGNGH